jgi:Tfp pilus assembly protein PilF
MSSTNIAAYEFLNRMLQASERGDPAEAEKYLKQALELDPENMDALRHAAGFYHIVTHDSAKARHYATLCRVQAAKVTAQMDEILGDGAEEEASIPAKAPASRHIGGIIGPY